MSSYSKYKTEILSVSLFLSYTLKNSAFSYTIIVSKALPSKALIVSYRP